MQIVQELCKRPGLNKAGFDMPTIYVPTLAEKPGRCVNQIEEVCSPEGSSGGIWSFTIWITNFYWKFLVNFTCPLGL